MLTFLFSLHFRGATDCNELQPFLILILRGFANKVACILSCCTFDCFTNGTAFPLEQLTIV
jgi:hypothetical protein